MLQNGTKNLEYVFWGKIKPIEIGGLVAAYSETAILLKMSF